MFEITKGNQSLPLVTLRHTSDMRGSSCVSLVDGRHMLANARFRNSFNHLPEATGNVNQFGSRHLKQPFRFKKAGQVPNLIERKNSRSR
jgi:hypothetical protein